jgi:3-oxoacyl-[acyl-carrier-protein] synthase III
VPASPSYVGIVGTGSYMPPRQVTLEDYEHAGLELTPLDRRPLVSPPQARHHVVPGERACEMIERAAVPMFERLGLDPRRDVDVLITNVLLPDFLFTGCGADTANQLGISPTWVIDLHNGGCASFQYMLKIASAIIVASGARGALIANVHNAAGQVFDLAENRLKSHSVSAGDGCGVAYVAAGGGAELLGCVTRNAPEVARNLGPSASDDRSYYWQNGPGTLDVRLEPGQAQTAMAMGNRLVPEVVRELSERCGFGVESIDLLITNQPNRVFLRNWRTSLGVDAERHLDTFDRFGNLGGAGVPVTLHDAATAGLLKQGDLVVMAGFAHAGEFAAAAAVRW